MWGTALELGIETRASLLKLGCLHRNFKWLTNLLFLLAATTSDTSLLLIQLRLFEQAKPRLSDVFMTQDIDVATRRSVPITVI
jgi:hypothetical protein